MTSELAELESRWAGTGMMSARSAPFGTVDTPIARMKIVGGKQIYVNENSSSNSLAPSDSPTSRRASPSHLFPLKQSNHSPDPAHYKHSPREPVFGFGSAVKDVHNSHIHPPVSREPSNLNPHPVVPPISPSKQNNDANKYVLPHRAPAASQLHSLMRHVPGDRYLPNDAISLSKNEELILRECIKDALDGFDSKKLRDIYVAMSGFDSSLSGEITFQDMSFTFMRHKLHIPADLLRLVAAIYITQPGKVNYERVLSFFASSLKNQYRPLPPDYETRGPPKEHPPSDGPKQNYNPLTHSAHDVNADKEYNKLLRLVQVQLENSGASIDMNRVHQVFQAVDREQRGVLSDSQIKQAACTCRIPLQESVLNQIIRRCDSSNGQYRWQDFVSFIERVQPSVTGLPIPDSKKPLEYAKVPPVPSADWPKLPYQPSPQPTISPRQDTMRGGEPVPTNRYSDQAPAAGVRMMGARQRSQNVSPTRNLLAGPPSRGDITSRAHSRHSLDMNDPPAKVYKSEGDPNGDLNLSHPRMERLDNIDQALQKQAQIEKLERELQQVEQEYKTKRSNMIDQEKNRQSQQKQAIIPWLDRFMKMAGAMYALDTRNTGLLPSKELMWIAEQYNVNYDLGLSSGALTNALRQSLSGDKVAIDSYLRIISMQGP